MPKFNLTNLFKSLVLMLGICFSTTLVHAEETLVNATLSRIGDATHLELTGVSNWKYEIKKQVEAGKTILVLESKPLTQKSIVLLKNYKDELVEKVSVNPNSVDDLTEIKLTLTKKGLESFDYMSDQPSRWVVDIFEKDENKKAAEKKEDAKPRTPASKKLPAKQVIIDEGVIDESDLGDPKNAADDWPAATSNARVEYAPKAKRKPSSDSILVNPDAESSKDFSTANNLNQGAFDGGDPEFKRFAIQDYEIKENAVIASGANIYLHFPILKLGTPELEELSQAPPIYKILPLDDEEMKKTHLVHENDEAKLLVGLFEKGRFAMFLKTAKEFIKQYPDSRYEEIVRYMMADTYFKFWKESKSPTDFDTAMSMYRGVSEKFKDSPLAARTHFFVAYSYLERGDNLSAVQAFQRFLNLKRDDQNFEQKKLDSKVKIAEARAFLSLNRLEEAYKILDEVEKTAEDKKDVITAAFYKGDIFFQSADYKRAVQEYKAAQTKYSKDWQGFPNAYFNSSEAKFWLGEYKESLNGYREFLQKFPNNEFGGFAMTRIGEILAVFGADPKRVRGAYLESNFRYKGTPGGELAKIRIISERMPEMKEKELKNSIEQVNEIKKEVSIPALDEFTTFLMADGYYNRGEYSTATDELIKFYQNNPIANNREKYKARIERNITTSIRKSAEQNNFLQALKEYGHFATNWLNGSGRIDTEFYVGRAYEQAGVFNEADRIYRSTLNKIYALKGTKIEKERGVFEILPTVDAVNLRLAVVANQNKEYPRAFNYLKEIKSPEKLTEEEQVERAQVSADVFEQRGDLANSKKFLQSLIDTWKGQPITVAPVYLRLAQLENQTKNYKSASTNLSKVINLQNDTALVPEETFAKALELKGDIELSEGKKREAVKSYEELLSQFGNKRPMASIRYKVGQILFDLGDLNEAQAIWNQLKEEKGDKNSTWYRLASEKMTSSKWKKEYKKYIDRIPAMADSSARNTRQ